MKKIITIPTLLFGLLISIHAQATSPIIGTWLTEKKDDENRQAKVEIAPCTTNSNQLCGKIVWLEEPRDPKTGELKLDQKNPDPTKRHRTIMGLEILKGFRKVSDTKYTGGSIYSAHTGKTYSSDLEIKGNNLDALHVTGKVLFFTRTQTWTRVKD